MSDRKLDKTNRPLESEPDEEDWGILPEDFTPPADWVKRMKITWQEFLELMDDASDDLPELLDTFAQKTGLSRPEVAYLIVGEGDERGWF